ncbi:sulfoacetaldehyde dehydrogenase SafD [Ferrimonas pelagia]|uniref:Aldehyde dehydrogenase family protein n=1 Tax=Ferrimonas pelagia TaxID=1177826 RepID=A0ABP9EJY2_9GAMM
MSTRYQVVNPYQGEVIGEYGYTSAEAALAAIATLKAGQRMAKAMVAHERADVLRKLAGLLERHGETLARLITAETGKTISDARVELSRAVNTTIASAEEARQIHGEALDSDAYAPSRGRIGLVCWRPLGTVLCITPFNFPLNIAMHKIGPAFAAGNCILFKPGPANTASARLLTELCYQAGIPQDVLQLCIPSLPDMAAIIGHPDIDAINFTGGTAAADAIAAAAGYKKLLLELGGNDPLILMPDGDVDAAVEAAINQRFATAGQRCTAAKRVFLHRDVHAAFRERLLARTRQLVVGDPSLEETFVGPVIHADAAAAVMAGIEQAVAAGASLLCGGKREGNVILPTILDQVTDQCALMTEELFGPVIPLAVFDSLTELIARINNTPYGLQAGVFTQDLRVIRQLFEALDVGSLMANDGPGFRAEHFPFGGVKGSGVGREGVKYAIREMSIQKTLVL